MTISHRSLESKIVKWLVDLIESEKLLEEINGIDDLEKIVQTFDQESVIPTFGFDQCSRKANAQAANTVLSNLGLLEIITIDKSVSLTKGQVLRPDILCFNPETRTLVVFEVKRDKLTERQTITELAGYEQELRNVLPFLGDFDINFVVISTQWDSLLDHAVANFNTWSSKYCLALEVAANNRPFRMKWRLPEAWHPRGGVGLPEEALQTIDVCLNELQEPEHEDCIPQTLITAMNVMARSGDRSGSHGFVMLWRDNSNLGSGPWSWTLCGIDPIAMHSWCNRHGLKIRQSKLTEYIDKQSSESPRLIPTVVYKIAKEAFPVLLNRYAVEFEGATSWSEKIENIRRRGTPVCFEFWGALGDYAREFVSHPGVREVYMPFLGRDELDWTHPAIALPLLGNICGDIPFPGGVIRCSDAYKAGVKLGLLEVLSKISQDHETEQKKLEPLLEWCFLEALRVAIEMGEIYRTSTELDEPPPALSKSPQKRLASIEALSQWVLDHLVGDKHPFHQLSFNIGRSGAPFFSEWLDPVEQDEFLHAHCEKIAQPLRHLLWSMVPEGYGFGVGSLKIFNRLLKRLGVSSESASESLKKALIAVPAQSLLRTCRYDAWQAIDEAVPVVFHSIAPLAEFAVDWENIKKSIRVIYEGGCKHPAVILSQNGSFGTGEVAGEYANFLTPIQNPEAEVYFVSEASIGMAAKMTWADLQAKFFL